MESITHLDQSECQSTYIASKTTASNRLSKDESIHLKLDIPLRLDNSLTITSPQELRGVEVKLNNRLLKSLVSNSELESKSLKNDRENQIPQIIVKNIEILEIFEISLLNLNYLTQRGYLEKCRIEYIRNDLESTQRSSNNQSNHSDNAASNNFSLALRSKYNEAELCDEIIRKYYRDMILILNLPLNIKICDSSQAISLNLAYTEYNNFSFEDGYFD